MDGLITGTTLANETQFASEVSKVYIYSNEKLTFE
jgi:hypothetical protein